MLLCFFNIEIWNRKEQKMDETQSVSDDVEKLSTETSQDESKKADEAATSSKGSVFFRMMFSKYWCWSLK